MSGSCIKVEKKGGSTKLQNKSLKKFHWNYDSTALIDGYFYIAIDKYLHGNQSQQTCK